MNCKSIKLIFLILVLSATAAAQKTSSAESLRKYEVLFHNLNDTSVPLFAFTYVSPWRNTYGSDSPEFVLYQDGTVIFTKCRDKSNPYSCYYKMARLSSNELSQTFEKLHSQEFHSFDQHYSTDTSKVVVTDLPYRRMVMRKPDGTYKKVSTYGALSGDEKGYVAENVPNSLKEIIEFVASYEYENSVDVDFEFVEVIVRPAGNSDDSMKVIKWSKELPDLNDSKTIKHKNYGAYSIFVNKRFRNEISRIFVKLEKCRLKNCEAALLINNQLWKAEFRNPFPSESIWLGNFREE